MRAPRAARRESFYLSAACWKVDVTRPCLLLLLPGTSHPAFLFGCVWGRAGVASVLPRLTSPSAEVVGLVRGEHTDDDRGPWIVTGRVSVWCAGLLALSPPSYRQCSLRKIVRMMVVVTMKMASSPARPWWCPGQAVADHL